MSKMKRTLSSASLPVSPDSPERMVLRSACSQYGCNTDLSLSDSPRSARGSPRAKTGHTHHHHHHHHFVKSSSPKVTTKRLEVVLKRQTVSTLISNGHKSVVPGQSSERGSRVREVLMSQQSFSSGFDSDIEDKPKTDYTYARGISYNSVTSPVKDSTISPNMSRNKLRSDTRSSLPDASSDDESSFLHGKVLHNMKRNYASREINQTSTPFYFLDFRSKETANSAAAEQVTDGAEEILFLKRESRSVFERTVTTITTVISTVLSKPLQTGSSAWSWFWSLVYRLVCNVLLLDTWLLSRTRTSWKNKFLFLLLLPLLVPLLLWATGSGLHETGSPEVSTSHFNNWASVKGSEWWAWLGSSWVAPPGGIDPPHAGFDLELLRERLLTESAALSLRSQEALNKQLSRLMEERDSSLKSMQEQMQFFARRNNELAEEIKIMRTNLKTQENSEVILNSECAALKASLVRVEGELDDLRDQLSLFRNCCRNQTLLDDSLDKHFAAVLFDILSGTGPRTGHFAKLGDLLHNRLHSEYKRQSEEDTVRLEVRLERLKRELREELRSQPVTPVTPHLIYGQSNLSCPSEDAVQRIVRNALFIYDADKIGKFDYALESAGGSVISTRCTETYHSGTAQFSLFGVPIWYTSNSPRTVIQPDVKPGQCWALKGTTGYLVIQLSTSIRPTAFTLEHIPKSLSPNGHIDSAPKDFSVLGLKDEKDFEGVHLGRYTYLDNDESLQYFIVQESDPGYFPIMELRIHSNHGNMAYTCLYRFRVHGTPL